MEFKRDDLHPEQLGKEIVAMLNLQGGKLLLGVEDEDEDEGSVSGIQRAELETRVMDTVFGRFVHPMALPFYEEVQLHDSKRVAVIPLTQGTAKPYVLRNNNREEIYIRVGTTSRLATREQQARLFETGGLLHAELLPVSGSGFKDLDQALIACARLFPGRQQQSTAAYVRNYTIGTHSMPSVKRFSMRLYITLDATDGTSSNQLCSPLEVTRPGALKIP